MRSFAIDGPESGEMKPIRCRTLGVRTHSPMEPSIKNLSLGRLHAARRRTGNGRWIQGTVKTSCLILLVPLVALGMRSIQYAGDISGFSG